WLLREYIKPVFKSSKETLQQIIDRQALRALFTVNANLFIRTLFLTSAFFFFTAQSAQFGTIVLAANAILINMLQMLAYGLDGFAHAAEALVGGAYGKRDKKAFSAAVRSSMLWAGIAALVISGLYALFGHSIIKLMTSIDPVIQIAESYLPWLIAAPVIAVWSYQFDGIFIGATQTTTMRNTVGIALLIYIIVALLSMPYWGNHALWASLLLFLFLRGVFLAFYYPKLVSQL
ncbi:MAG: MATE family efflux transporter, partial [Thiotrichaceae bacterium]